MCDPRGSSTKPVDSTSLGWEAAATPLGSLKKGRHDLKRDENVPPQRAPGPQSSSHKGNMSLSIYIIK